MRVISSRVKLAASPDPPLARLHNATLIPHRIQREYRSASQPNSGAKIMYEMMNAVCSEPIFALAAGSLRKKVSSIFGKTAARTWRSM